MLEHAQRFLGAVLPSSFGEGAFINVHWSGLGHEGRRYWDGRACATIAEAVKAISWANSMQDKDIYICMSTQSKCEVKTSSKGNVYKKAMRLATDAVALRSLFIDIDVKDDPKGYPTTAAAMDALREFIGAVGLPMPTAVVASGSGGFHVHWAMDADMEPAKWQDLAFRLANATRTHGLKCDTQCTVDSARILRVPQTYNRKQEEPKEVTLLSLGDQWPVEIFQELLDRYEPMAGTPSPAPITLDQLFEISVTTTVSPIPFQKNDDLGMNIESGGGPLDISVGDLARVCPFVLRSLGTGGVDNDQPLWFMTASIATFLDDGRDALHAMSNKHPGYSAKETDALYDRTVAKQRERDMGWPTCQRIASYGCKDCSTCPLLAAGKSPLHHAMPKKTAEVDETMPERYTRNTEGMIYYKNVDEEGNMKMVPVCNYPIFNGWLSNNPWTFHFTTKTDAGKRTIIEMPTEVIFGRDGISKYLGSKGFFCTEQQYRIVKEFFVSWLQKLQMSKDSVISAAPFGWSVVDGKVEGFTFAGRVWMRGDDRPAANPNPVLSFQYTPKGDIAPWRELAEVVYSQGRPALDAILAVGFAGPLVRYTGFPGLILNAYSAESGIGKTTAMKVSQSVWGHPVLAMQGLNDTSNSVLGKMGQIRHLPMYWDEIKSEAQVKRFCSIVFDLTGGREKTRMNADATLKMSGTWQTLLVSASNDSLVDGMAREVGSTTAGLHRLFEFVVPKPAQVTHDVGVVQRLAGKLEDNYGHAGLIYAKFLGANHARIEHEVAAMQDELYTTVRVKQEERMWVATMAVVLMGARYANELGLLRIDEERLRDFLVDVLERMRGEVQDSPSDLNNDMSVSTVLAEFLNSTRSRNTLITNRIWVSRGKPTKGAIQVKSDVSKLGEIMVQIGQEDRLIRISSVALTRWMGERGYSRHTFVKKLESEFGLTKVNGKLGGGTDMACAMEHLVELDMNHPKLSAFIE